MSKVELRGLKRRRRREPAQPSQPDCHRRSGPVRNRRANHGEGVPDRLPRLGHLPNHAVLQGSPAGRCRAALSPRRLFSVLTKRLKARPAPPSPTRLRTPRAAGCAISGCFPTASSDANKRTRYLSAEGGIFPLGSSNQLSRPSIYSSILCAPSPGRAPCRLTPGGFRRDNAQPLRDRYG
jgi:hypothetical protein